MVNQENLDYLKAWGLGRFVGIHMAMRAAIELDVFDIIANAGPQAQLTPSEIVAQIPTNNPHASISLEKILKMLSANGLLKTSLKPGKTGQERAYGLTEETYWLANGDESKACLAPIVLYGSQRELVNVLFKLKDCVLRPDCLAFEEVHGESMFEYCSKKPELSKLFNDCMSHTSKVMVEEMLKVYSGFEGIKELMDVAGGIGTSIQKIVSANPHIRGINFDLPHVIADAPQHPGVKHMAGNMFESLPNAETMMLKWILHDWDDERCIKLLKNCWKALPAKGKVIVVECVSPEVFENNPESQNAAAGEFFMMVVCPGGKERTAAEFDDLAKAAGFVQTKIFPIVRGIHVIEFIK